MTPDSELRRQLINLLLKRQAHLSLEDAVADFPPAHFNTRPPNVSYSFWHLLEHLRIAQGDILEYIGNPGYVELAFPEEYWPDPGAEADEAGWRETVRQFLADRQALVDIVNHPDTDLLRPLPHGSEDHNILREILIVADHNAYHIGEFAILRGALNIW